MTKVVHQTTIPDAAFVQLHPLLLWHVVVKAIVETGTEMQHRGLQAKYSKVLIFIETEIEHENQ